MTMKQDKTFSGPTIDIPISVTYPKEYLELREDGEKLKSAIQAANEAAIALDESMKRATDKLKRMAE
jgi:hypothetical protein